MPKSWSFRASMAMRTATVSEARTAGTGHRRRRSGQVTRMIADQTVPGSRRQLALQPQVRSAAAGATPGGASRRRPAGCGGRRARGRPGSCAPRAAAQVHDLATGREEDPAAARADRGAEVDVLGVQEEPLVEQADRLGVGAPHEQARAADPVHALRPVVSAALDRAATGPPPAVVEPARRASAAARSAAPIIGPNDSSGRPSASTRRGPATAASGCARRSRHERVDRARRHDGVAVEQQHQVARPSPGCRGCSPARTRGSRPRR